MMPGLSNFKNIVVLIGAGISADSGLATFRDSHGLWEQHRMEDVATWEAFERDPQLVWRFYSMRRIQAARAHPNQAHKSLTEFASKISFEQKIHLITQNVDVLHHRSDPQGFLEPICMHGSLHESRCSHCDTIYFDDYAYFDLAGNYAPQETQLCNATEKASTSYLHHYHLEYRHFLPLSPCCKSPIRPHIVFFGEMPLFMEKISKLLSQADLFVTIGTSGLVYPAAGFLEQAKRLGARTVCLNKEMIPQNKWIDEFKEGRAIDTVPDFFRN
jgi:NAD-dependent deacetylase